MTEKSQGVLYGLYQRGRKREVRDKVREPSRDQTMQGFVDKGNRFRFYSKSNKKS